jgi:hypothetical protein
MARITQRLTAIEVTNLKEKGLYPDGDGLCLRSPAPARNRGSTGSPGMAPRGTWADAQCVPREGSQTRR